MTRDDWHAARVAAADASRKLWRTLGLGLLVLALLLVLGALRGRSAGAPVCAERGTLVGRLEGDGLKAIAEALVDGKSAALFTASDGRMALVVETLPGVACLIATGVHFQPYRPPEPPPPANLPQRDGA